MLLLWFQICARVGVCASVGFNTSSFWMLVDSLECTRIIRVPINHIPMFSLLCVRGYISMHCDPTGPGTQMDPLVAPAVCRCLFLLLARFY